MIIGTHRPGEHSVYAPAPKQIEIARVLPPVSEDDVRRFRQKRRAGSAAPGGGTPPVTHPLLTDLVAGWALTSGPQQTLDSSGVIASGPLDLIQPNGLITYDATKGAVCVDTLPDAIAFRVGGNALNFLGESIFTHCIVERIDSGNPTFTAFIQPCSYPDGAVQQFYCEGDWGDSGSASTYMVVFTADNNPTINSVPTTSGPFAFSAWSSPTQSLNGVNIVPGPGENTQPFISPFNDWGGATPGIYIAAENAPNVYIKYARIWIGANAETIITNATWRAWLDNSGAGRTDAELAAYTGA